jgi:hypothetical protein
VVLLNLISKIALVVVFSASLIISKELFERPIYIEFNGIELNISSEYTHVVSFKDYPKYNKVKDQLRVSSFHVKDKASCINFCENDFKGEVFEDGFSTKRLSLFNGDGYSASLWDIEITFSEGTTTSRVGIIYNDNIMLQVNDDITLWRSLLSQLKSKS